MPCDPTFKTGGCPCCLTEDDERDDGCESSAVINDDRDDDLDGRCDSAALINDDRDDDLDGCESASAVLNDNGDEDRDDGCEAAVPNDCDDNRDEGRASSSCISSSTLEISDANSFSVISGS